MKAVVLIVLFAIAALSVSAANLDTARYVIVVGEKAPAADVVTGANFAASMKAASGTTYTSALDTEAYASLSDEDLATKYLVVIDGANRRVKLLGENPSAEEYFITQGFDVATIDSPSRQDVLLSTPPRTQSPSEPPELIEEDRETSDAIVPPAPVQQPEPTPTPTLTVENRQAQQTPDEVAPQAPRNATVTPQQTPSVVDRIWRWFADLF